VKRALTKVIFTKLLVDDGEVTGHDLTPGIHGLVTAQRELTVNRAGKTTGSRQRQPTTSTQNGSPLSQEEASIAKRTDAELLGLALSGQGSSRAAMVELRGIEPLTFSMRRAGSPVR
jgi:hypothetical protein